MAELAWHDGEAVRAWKSAAEFRERLARVLQHAENFQPAEIVVVATSAATAAGTAQHRKGA